MTITPPTLDEEVWGTFPRDESYMISTLGRIWNRKYNRLVSAHKGKNGYCRFKIFPPGEKGRHCKILLHRAVLETFFGGCPEGFESSHLNGDRSDNRLMNLCYETRKQNNLRRVFTGQQKRGTQCPNAKLTEEIVLKARKEWKKGVRGHGANVLARKYGVDPSTMWDALSGHHWASVPTPPGE